MLIPGGVNRLRGQLLEAVTQEDWDRGQGLGDDELTSE